MKSMRSLPPPSSTADNDAMAAAPCSLDNTRIISKIVDCSLKESIRWWSLDSSPARTSAGYYIYIYDRERNAGP